MPGEKRALPEGARACLDARALAAILLKYEKGEIFPRIDTLERMCRLYETSVEYVLYGNDKMAFFEQRSSSLTVLFLLSYTRKKVAYDRESGRIDILIKSSDTKFRCWSIT